MEGTKNIIKILLMLIASCSLLIGCNHNEPDQNLHTDLPSTNTEMRPESSLLPEDESAEEPKKEKHREGEEILIEIASIEKSKLLSDAFSKFVGATFGELKEAFPKIEYMGFKSEYWNYACDSYAITEKDKVFYITQGQQSMYYGIPNEFKNDFSKITDLYIWGLYGEIGTLFPIIDRTLSIEVFGELLGVEIVEPDLTYFPTSGLYGFEYEGYVCWFNTKEGNTIISPETNIELSYNNFSPELISKEKQLMDELWLEVDPEGAAAFFGRE